MSTPLLMVGVPTVLTTNTTTALPASSTLISFQSAAGSTIEASNDGTTWGTLATSAAGVVVSVFTAAVFIRTATANTTVTAKATTTRSQAAFLAGNGTVVAPAYSFINEPSTGFVFGGPGIVGFATGGIFPAGFIPSGIQIASNKILGWSPATFAAAANDSGISRLGAASLALGNGTAGDFTGTLKLTGLIINSAAPLLTTSVALTDQAGVGAGTITNAPTAGNPTKWIAINDNGTTRKIPTWT